MNLDHAVAVLADEFRGIKPGAALVPDVKADAQPLVAAAYARKRRLRSRVKIGVVRAVVVDGRPEIVLDAVLLEQVHHLVALQPPLPGRAYLAPLIGIGYAGDLRIVLERHDGDVLHPVALRELARGGERLLVREVERPEGNDLYAELGALLLVGCDFAVGRVAPNRAVDEAEVVAVHVLKHLQHVVERLLVHRVAGDAKLVRQRRDAAARAKRSFLRRTLRIGSDRICGAHGKRSHRCGHENQFLHC